MPILVDFDPETGHFVARRHGRVWRVAVGRGGLTVAKREGDGATPIGCFALRRLYYRPDRLDPPRTRLEVAPIKPDMGWCDDPESPDYNRLVRLPCDDRHEKLWREDGAYDLIVPLGYNDGPIVAGRGSAIFLHVAKSDFSPTAGCVAMARDDLLALLGEIDPDTRLCVSAR